MEFVCYNDWNQLPDSAETLFRQYEHDSVFLSRTWFQALSVTALEQDATLMLACVVEGADLLAILPLKRRTGDSWYSLSNRYTSHFSPLVADTDRAAILRCLVGGLSRLPFRTLRLEPVLEHEPNIESMLQEMESAGFTCHRYFKFYNWIHRVKQQSFSEYFAGRPAILRNSIMRKRRKLEREHGCEIRLFTSEDLDVAMEHYDRIYRASWKAEEPHGAFIRVLVNRLGEKGWTRLAVLYAAGEPAALGPSPARAPLPRGPDRRDRERGADLLRGEAPEELPQPGHGRPPPLEAGGRPLGRGSARGVGGEVPRLSGLSAGRSR